MIRGWFFDGFTGRNGPVFLLLRVHICELQPRIRFARDWQDFVCPYLGITIDRNVWRPSLAVGFMPRQLGTQLLLMRLDECRPITFPQPAGAVRKQRVYCVVVQEAVHLFLINSEPA